MTCPCGPAAEVLDCGTARLRHSSSLGDPSFDLHQIGREKCEILLLELRKGRAGCQFRWLRIETCVSAQLKRWFAKRTANRKQRAIIMSHSSTPNISS